MRIVIAPDKFKGSLDACGVGAAIADGIRSCTPDADITVVPMADGGEGTLEAAIASGFMEHSLTVTGPLGAPLNASFAIQDHFAVVELARSSGLELLPPAHRNALAATSRGTGELIAAALDAGATTIVLAIGGSASTDGGAGMLAALGARFFDEVDRELPDGGAALTQLHRADFSRLDPRLATTRFILASDVDNPLLGPRGAAAVFGPQKGASRTDIVLLELALTRFATHVVKASALGGAGIDATTASGAGAAGGVGFAALQVLGATQRPGVDMVAEFTRLRAHLAGADLVITGEGSFDQQSLGGKTPVGVVRAARSLQIPTIAVCGTTTLTESHWRAAGFAGCYAVMDRAPNRAESMQHADRYLRDIGSDIAGRLRDDLQALASPRSTP